MANLYSKLDTELAIAENAKIQLKQIQKPYLIFEGKTDNNLFSHAYQVLKNKDFDEDYFLNKHDESQAGGTIGSGAPFIGEFLRNHINKMPTDNLLIGVFDFDSEGYNQLKGLKNLYDNISIQGFNDCIIYQHKSYQNFYAISLVTPSFRSNFTHLTHHQHCHLSTELLFHDSDIPTGNRAYPTLFDRTVFGFTGDKKKFANKITKKLDDGESLDFSGFQQTIDLIEKLKEITDANRH